MYMVGPQSRPVQIPAPQEEDSGFGFIASSKGGAFDFVNEEMKAATVTKQK